MPVLNSCSGALVLFPVEVVELTEDATYIQRIRYFTSLWRISQKSPLATTFGVDHSAFGLWRRARQAEPASKQWTLPKMVSNLRVLVGFHPTGY